MATQPRWLLLVDDEPAFCMPCNACSGGVTRSPSRRRRREAARLAAVCEFAAVLTDHDLPGRSGAWLLVQLATKPGLRKVLTSGRDIPGSRRSTRRAVVDRFVKKPATPEELFEALEG